MKIVVLVDPFTGGHHTAYIRIFGETLINLGYTVWAFVSEEEELEQWIVEKHPDWHGTKWVTVNYNAADRPFRRLGRFNEAASMAYRWWHLRKRIKEQEHKYRSKVSSVFFAWLDSYLAGYLMPEVLGVIFPYKWSGLYFHPRHMRIGTQENSFEPSLSDIDIAITTRHCQGIAVHDEGIVAKFEKRLKKKVVLFPEIADDTPPKYDNSIAKQIRGQADGRLIVGAIGLSRHQGMLTLMRTAKQADRSNFFFVFVGRLDMMQFADKEQEEIQTFFDGLPENCFAHFGSLKEGEEYNSVFSALDVPFLVYENFASASNRLTKAAIFEKHVLSQNTYCIGEDVQKYGLGVTVEEKNISQCLIALEELKFIVNNNNSSAKFEKYRAIHSLHRLKNSFENIFT